MLWGWVCAGCTRAVSHPPLHLPKPLFPQPKYQVPSCKPNEKPGIHSDTSPPHHLLARGRREDTQHTHGSRVFTFLFSFFHILYWPAKGKPCQGIARKKTKTEPHNPLCFTLPACLEAASTALLVLVSLIDYKTALLTSYLRARHVIAARKHGQPWGCSSVKAPLNNQPPNKALKEIWKQVFVFL